MNFLRKQTALVSFLSVVMVIYVAVAHAESSAQLKNKILNLLSQKIDTTNINQMLTWKTDVEQTLAKLGIIKEQYIQQYKSKLQREGIDTAIAQYTQTHAWSQEQADFLEQLKKDIVESGNIKKLFTQDQAEYDLSMVLEALHDTHNKMQNIVKQEQSLSSAVVDEFDRIVQEATHIAKALEKAPQQLSQLKTDFNQAVQNLNQTLTALRQSLQQQLSQKLNAQIDSLNIIKETINIELKKQSPDMQRIQVALSDITSALQLTDSLKAELAQLPSSPDTKAALADLTTFMQRAQQFVQEVNAIIAAPSAVAPAEPQRLTLVEPITPTIPIEQQLSIEKVNKAWSALTKKFSELVSRDKISGTHKYVGYLSDLFYTGTDETNTHPYQIILINTIPILTDQSAWQQLFGTHAQTGLSRFLFRLINETHNDEGLISLYLQQPTDNQTAKELLHRLLTAIAVYALFIDTAMSYHRYIHPKQLLAHEELYNNIKNQIDSATDLLNKAQEESNIIKAAQLLAAADAPLNAIAQLNQAIASDISLVTFKDASYQAIANKLYQAIKDLQNKAATQLHKP